MRKMNKHIAVIVALIISTLSCYSQNAQLVLVNKHIFQQYPPQLQKESPYNAIGLPTHINAVDTIINVTVENKNGEYYRFGPRLSIFLKPGSKVTLDYDYRNSYLSKFTGDLAKENEFLNCVILSPSHAFDNTLNYSSAKSYKEFITILKRYEDNLISKCEVFKKERAFYDDCRARIDFIIALAHNEFLSLSEMTLRRDIKDENILNNKLKELRKNISPAIKQNIKSRLSKYNENKIISYRQGCTLLANIAYGGESLRECGYTKYSDIYDYSVVKYDIEYMYSPDLLSLANKMKDSTVLGDINSFLKDNQRLFNGSPFKDAEVIDGNGVKCKLSDLKGSVLYIDLWATWCNPCKALAPSFYALADSMSENKNIKFISISIDSKFKTWQNYVIKHPHTQNVKAYHIDDDAFIKHNNITSIPRFIIVDKEFKIRAAYASKPLENRIGILKEQLEKMSNE